MKDLVAARWNDWALAFMKTKDPNWARAKDVLEKGLKQVDNHTLRKNLKLCEEKLTGAQKR